MLKNIDFIVVGKLISTLRNSRHLNQQELADILKVSKPAICQWENGGGIKTEKLYEIAKYFGISVAELINGKLNTENEDIVFQRNYDLDDHPDFSKITPENETDVFEYLSRCKNVIEKFFKMFPLYLNKELNKKQEREFDILLSYFNRDDEYLYQSPIDPIFVSLSNVIEDIEDVYGIKDNKEVLDYELKKIFELRIEILPDTILAYESESLVKNYLTLLTQQQKDELLTQYVDKKNKNEIIDSIEIRRLMNSGARCFYLPSSLSPRITAPISTLKAFEGKIIKDEKMNDAEEYCRNNDMRDNIYGEISDRYTWKFLSYYKYEDYVDKVKTNDIKALLNLRNNDNKGYMDYLKNRDYEIFKN